MMKKVRNIEIPIRSWLAGALGTPRAVRTNPKTITMRVKLVMSMIREGASVSSVITITICMAVLRFSRSFPLPIWRLINGLPGAETDGALGAVGALGAAGAVGEVSRGGKGVGPGVCAWAGVASKASMQERRRTANLYGARNFTSVDLFFPFHQPIGQNPSFVRLAHPRHTDNQFYRV